LVLYHNGSYRNESVWNDGDNCISPCFSPNDGATGGAPSTIFTDATLPTQHAVAALSGNLNLMRKVSDVAYNASPNTGVVLYIGFTSSAGPAGFYAVGGTSQGPPQWAGIVAIANQLRQAKGYAALGWITDRIYQVYQNTQNTKGASFHDVRSGDNAFPTGLAAPLNSEYFAGTGYDYPTGLGSPDVTSLVNALSSSP
jgi:subtilase family serine protease